jgi:hypothetical protein
MSSFIGCEQSKAIVEKYDKNSLFPMLLECHKFFLSLNLVISLGLFIFPFYTSFFSLGLRVKAHEGVTFLSTYGSP